MIVQLCVGVYLDLRSEYGYIQGAETDVEL